MESENRTNTETKQEEMSPWQMIVGIIAILGMSFWIWNSFIKGESDGNITKTPSVEIEQEEVKTYSDYDAYVNAQDILEKFLKSPSTAEYPVASKATIKRYTDDGFRVESYVDSQNGFGAVVRSDWIVVFQFVEDSVKVLAVVLDGETLYKAE